VILNKSTATLLGLALTAVSMSLFAQSYPNKPVKIIVPFAAGGSADNYARFLGKGLQDALGQSFVVENRPGAGSVIGTDAVAKSAADGYTLLMMSNTQTVNETLVQGKPYQLMRDFVAIAPVNYSDLVLVANPSAGFSNLKDMTAQAKARPGKINYASSGTGTPYHMAGELFKSMAGVYLVHIPYRGSSGARTDVIGGQVEVMFDAVTTMSEQIKAGKVKAIATTGKVRSTCCPTCPPWPRQVWRAMRPLFGLAFWLPKARPKMWWTSSMQGYQKLPASPM